MLMLCRSKLDLLQCHGADKLLKHTEPSLPPQECHHTLRLCNGQAKDLRAQFYQGESGGSPRVSA